MINRIREYVERGEYVLAGALGHGLYLLEEVEPATRAEAALLAAEAMHQLRNFPGALLMARRAHDLAEQTGHKGLLGQALFRLCGTMAAAGESRLAIEMGERYLQGLDHEWPDLAHLRGRALTNIGMAFKARRMYPDALQQLTQALGSLEATADTQGLVKARHLMAWVLIDMGEPEEAQAHLEASAHLIAAVPEFESDQIAHLAYLRFRQGRLTEADRLAEELVAPKREEVSLACQAVGLYVRGCVRVASGAIEEARWCHTHGQELAMQSEVVPIMNLMTDLLSRITAIA